MHFNGRIRGQACIAAALLALLACSSLSDDEGGPSPSGVLATGASDSGGDASASGVDPSGGEGEASEDASMGASGGTADSAGVPDDSGSGKFDVASPSGDEGGASSGEVGSSGDATGSADSIETTTAAESSDESGDSTTGNTGLDTEGSDPECSLDDDCALLDDCCNCEAYPISGRPPPGCDAACEQAQCAIYGVGKSVCRHGTCVPERVDCDSSDVTCPATPPACDPGSLPAVVGDCWAPSCVPAQFCDTVPDCTVCPADHFCVTDDMQMGTKIRCELVPPSCDMGSVTCECAAAFCQAPYDTCVDNDEGLHCACPQC